MKISTVIFDYDNTLEEWLPYEAEVDVLIAKRISGKYNISPKDFLKEFNSIKRDRVHKKAFPEEYSRVLWITEALTMLGIKPDYNFVDDLVRYYWEQVAEKSKLFPNSLKVLKTLKGRYKLALISDSDGCKGIKINRVKRIGIYDFFDIIVTSDDTGVNKPDKKNFEIICKKLKVKPSACMMIGDVPLKDLSTPKKMGMVVVWSKQGMPTVAKYGFVDFEVNDIIEVLDILKKINKE